MLCFSTSSPLPPPTPPPEVCFTSHVKLTPGWVLVRINFVSIQEISRGWALVYMTPCIYHISYQLQLYCVVEILLANMLLIKHCQNPTQHFKNLLLSYSAHNQILLCIYLDLNGHHSHLVSIADLNITWEWFVWTAKQIFDFKLKLSHFAQKENPISRNKFEYSMKSSKTFS